MSGRQPGELSLPREHALDPRLYERSHNQLAPMSPARLDQRGQRHNTTLPSISPYSTDYYPQDMSRNAASSQQLKDYGHDYEQHLVAPEILPVQQLLPDIYQKPLNPQYNNFQQHHQSHSSMAEHPSSPPSIERQSRSLAFASDVAAEYQASLAAVSGVKIPSKQPPSEHPLHRPDIPPISNAACFCPICEVGYLKRSEVWSHFVACVARNGNPNGAFWDDGLVMGTQSSSSEFIPPQPSKSSPALSERAKMRRDRLAAVNGVVIPSKVAGGEGPLVLPSSTKTSMLLGLSCPLCYSPFSKKDHIKSHFPACVDRNGNPQGLRWDERLPALKRGPRATQRSIPE